MGRGLYNLVKKVERAADRHQSYYEPQYPSQLEMVASYEYNQYKKQHLFHGLPDFKDYMAWRYYNPSRSLANTSVDLIKAEINQLANGIIPNAMKDTFFRSQCMEELTALRNNATTEELIMLQLSSLEDYMDWRKLWPNSDPRDFFTRAGAPDVSSITNQYKSEIIRSLLEKKLRE